MTMLTPADPPPKATQPPAHVVAQPPTAAKQPPAQVVAQPAPVATHQLPNVVTVPPAPKKSMPPIFIIAIAAMGCLTLLVLFILGAIIVPNHLRARAQGQRVECQSNLINMSTALEMYSTINHLHYPLTLDDLTPDYLRTIPTCPAAGLNTYVYTSQSNPDNFQIYCAGENHTSAGLGQNQPSYTSTGGLKP